MRFESTQYPGFYFTLTYVEYAEDVEIAEPQTFDSVLGEYLEGMDALLLPEDHSRYCSNAAREAIRRFRGTVITCGYELDEGSFLYLQEKTKRLLASKMS